MKHWPLFHNQHLDLEAFSLEEAGSFIEIVEPGVAYVCVVSEGRITTTLAGAGSREVRPGKPALLTHPGTYAFTVEGPCAGLRGTVVPVVSTRFARQAREISEAIATGGLFLAVLVAWSLQARRSRRHP